MWCVSDHWATRTPRAFIKTWASGLVLCLSYLWWHHFSNRLAKCFNPWTSREGIGGAEDLPVLAALLLMHSWYNRKTYSSQQKSTRATTVRKLKSLLINWGYERLIPPLINTSLEKWGCDAFRGLWRSEALRTSLFCWVCCHLHLLFRASLSAPLFIMVYRDFLSIRSLSWKPHIPDHNTDTQHL